MSSGATLMISLKLVVQIVACVVVLILSNDEKPHVPLRAWTVVYLCDCVGTGTLALMDWNYSTQSFGVVINCFKWIMFCFGLAWNVVGIVWLSKGSAASRSEAPILFWSCLAFLISTGMEIAILVIILVITIMCAPPITMSLVTQLSEFVIVML